MADLYIDMSSGVAGDMLVAALLHLDENPSEGKASLVKQLRSLKLNEEIQLTEEIVKVNGITSLKINFATPEDDWAEATPSPPHHHHHHHHQHHHHHHHHRDFKGIKKILEESELSAFVKEEAIKTFELLGIAEAKVHQQELNTIHFHEVGSLDAILEIVSFYLLIEKYQIKKVFSSPVILGSGYVNCQHGKMPVPVPAVLEMLKIKKAPFRKITENTGELTTPTGLALVLNSSNAFVFPQGKTIAALGYGAGHKEIKGFTNVVRVLRLENHSPMEETALLEDEVVEITTTIDDMNGEEVAFLLQGLFALNVLDVSYKSVFMKKGRMGYEMTILVKPNEERKVGAFLLKNSSTLGYRYEKRRRKKLVRRVQEIPIKNAANETFALLVKEAYWGGKLLKRKIEFDSLEKMLPPSNLTKEEILAQVDRFYKANF